MLALRRIELVTRDPRPVAHGWRPRIAESQAEARAEAEREALRLIAAEYPDANPGKVWNAMTLAERELWLAKARPG